MRAALITASSLYSRAAAVVLLILVARSLDLEDFGVFAVFLGLAVLIANVFSVGAADIIATAAIRSPPATWRRILRALCALTTTAALFSLLAELGNGYFSILSSAASVSITTVVAMVTMNFIRGTHSPLTAAIIGYVPIPTARLAAVIAVSLLPNYSASLTAIMSAISWAGLLTACGILATLFFNRPTDPGSATESTQKLSSLVFLGISISAAWATLGQTDVTALAITQSPEVSGLYVPTMRSLEALTAIGIAYKFMATKRLSAASPVGPTGTELGRLAAVYFIAAGLVLLVGPLAIPVLFGGEFTFLIMPGVCLALAYWFSILVTINIQVLIAKGRVRWLTYTCSAVSVCTLVCVSISAELFGAVGAATADLLIFLAWYLFTRAATKSTGREERIGDN